MNDVSYLSIDDIKCERISVNPVTYFQKPIIGNAGGSADLPPIQLIFPNGGFGLGIAVKEQTDEGLLNSGDYPVIASGPEFSEMDEMENNGLRVAFFALAVCNLIITSLMFFRADTVDPTKVEYSVNPLPGVFEMVPSERRNVETVNYCFVVITLFVGCASTLVKFPLGLSAYALSVVLNFLLGTSSLPFFIYSLRYIFDVFMLYIGLVYRSRLMYAFLPAHVHRP